MTNATPPLPIDKHRPHPLFTALRQPPQANKRTAMYFPKPSPKPGVYNPRMTLSCRRSVAGPFSSRVFAMARSVVFGLMLAAAVMVAAPAFAQRGQGGRGGFGGPGGGGELGQMMFLLQDENVRKELEIVDDQIEKMRELGRKSFDGMREMFTGLRDLSEEERNAKLEEIRTQMEARQKELMKEADDILLPHQKTRLQQIVVQSQLRRQNTSDALSNGKLAEELGITADQKEQLAKIQEEATKDMEEKIAKAREDAKNKVLKVLTAEQRAKLDKLIGTPIEFSNRGFGGGGPGGRGPGGGGNNPGGQRPDGN